MLEIIINGVQADLSPSTSVSLTIENPFVIQDRIPISHSVGFDLPPTPKNQKIFDYASRVQSIVSGAGFYKEYRCQLKFDAVVISSGFLELLDFHDQFRCVFKAAEISSNLRHPLPVTEMERFDFPTSDPWSIDFDNPSNYAYDYKTLAQQAASGNNDKMVVAPIRMGGEDPLDFIHGIFRMEVFGEVTETPIPKNTAAMMSIEYINFYNPKTSELMLRWPAPPTIRPFDVAHAPVFPFVRLHYMLDQLLTGRLDNNFFAVGELADLVIPSTYFKNWIAPDTWLYVNLTKGMMFESMDPNPFFRINSFQANTLAPEFIRQVLKLFCATLISRGGRFILKKNRDIVLDTLVADWDSQVIGKPTISIEKGQVYHYGYGASVENKEFPSIKEVDSVNEMIEDDIAPISDGSNEVIYRIASTGQTFRKTSEKFLPPNEEEGLVVRDRYELLENGLGHSGEPDSGSLFSVVSALKPMDVGPAEYWWSAQNTADIHPETAWWCVPVWREDRTIRPENAQIMFYRGMADAPNGDSYPLISPYNVHPDGSAVGEYSLAWEGSSGLIQKFHKEFKEWVEKDKVKVAATVRLTARDLNNLDVTKKVHLRGRKFYIKEIRVTLKSNKIEPAVCDFIEA